MNDDEQKKSINTVLIIKSIKHGQKVEVKEVKKDG